MRENKAEHIVDLIERTPFGGLSEGDLSTIREHTATCNDCHSAFEAAYVSNLLLQERAAETTEPSPFFETRVLATLRERQANEAWSFARLWKSAGALASSMAATVALLLALTFVIPATQESSSNMNAYSAEGVLLNYAPEDLNSDAQVLSTLYEAEEDVVK